MRLLLKVQRACRGKAQGKVDACRVKGFGFLGFRVSIQRVSVGLRLRVALGIQVYK